MTEALLKQHKIVLDDIDRQIIQATQSGLPLVSHPYHVIAERLGLDAKDVILRLQTMKQNGIIRRIAAVPNHYALGYKGNGMSVWDVPGERVNELGKKVGALDFVSHCYHRPRFLPEWPYNLFAMVHAHNKDEALLLVDSIADLLGEFDRGHDVLFSKQILKKTGMRLIS
ncbi:MAG: AsnC family transcriptional regulator [Gammaproteobacteria bacterium]|nr:AsnC family transcriptional regulator [Gammaproteobacteria bacterium]MDH5659613.1 AsnC family transcriptional regulator [Gammaproteobacteria bacterium]